MNRKTAWKRSVALRRVAFGCALIGLWIIAGPADLLAQLQNPVPAITAPLVPPSAPPGIYSVAVHITGTGFISASVVKWNGTPIMTQFVSSAQLIALVPQADLVVAGSASISVTNPPPAGGTSNSVTFNIAASPFAPTLSNLLLPLSLSPLTPIVADFNGDGKLDLAMSTATVDANGTLLSDGAINITIQLGNGDGSFKDPITYSVGQMLTQPVAGDFNGDGKLDLAVGSSTSFGGYVLLGNGDGTFQAPLSFDLNPLGNNFSGVSIPIVGDFDRDGKLDLIFVRQSKFQILFGNGDGTFRNLTDIPIDIFMSSVVTADFNRDGKLDLAISGSNSAHQSELNIYLGNGDGTFQPPKSTSFAPPNLVATDLNGDGIVDLIGRIPAGSFQGQSGFTVLLGNGDGTFQPHVDYANDFESGPPLITDINGDGKLDVIYSPGPGATLAIYLGKGDGTFQTEFQFVAGSYPEFKSTVVEVAGDFNNDGQTDLVLPIIHPSTGSNLLMLLQGEFPALSYPLLVDFQKPGIGVTTPHTVTLVDTGLKSVVISSLALSGPDAATFSVSDDTCTGTNLSPSATCTFTANYRPVTSAAHNAKIVVTDDAIGAPHTIALTGATDTGAGLVLSPLNLTFSAQPVGTPSPAQTVTVTSGGDSDLQVLQIDIVGPNASDFSQINNCTSSLPVGTSCQINFTFTPSDPGTRVASVTIGYNNLQDSPQTITLTGNRISGPGLLIDPLALNFPSSSFNNQTPKLNVTLVSAGTAAVSIAGITITGADSSRFSQTNTCGSTLPVNDSCQISVTQFPVMFQTVTATLQILDNASGSPHLIPLTGPPKPTPLPMLSPSSLTFPAQAQGSGSAAQAVTITSVGQEPLLISGFVFTGANPDEFGVFSTTCPLQNTLQPGDSCQASIWFTPHTVGTRSATFGLSDNSPILNPPIPTTMVTLTGTGTAPALPMASVAPSSVSFPSQFVGTSVLPQNVILTNTGSVAITITSIAASPADFGELTTCGTTLAAGASCSIGVFFDPSASGTRAGMLTITDSAGNSPQTVSLSGTGEDFSVTPAAAPTATVKAGQTAVYMLNLTPGGGFSQQVTFTCAGAPVEASCVVSPNPAMLSGLSTTVAVNVTTTAKSLLFLRAPTLNPEVLVKYWSLALEFLLAGLILIWNQQRRDKRGSMGLTTVLLLSCALLTISACGGGSSSGPNTGNPNIPGTTAGTYTITVTATYTTGSSTLSHQTNLTLVVQ